MILVFASPFVNIQSQTLYKEVRGNPSRDRFDTPRRPYFGRFFGNLSFIERERFGVHTVLVRVLSDDADGEKAQHQIVSPVTEGLLLV